MQVIYRYLTVSIGCLLYHMHYGYEGRTSTPTSKGIVDSAWCAIAVHKMIIDFFVIFVTKVPYLSFCDKTRQFLT